MTTPRDVRRCFALLKFRRVVGNTRTLIIPLVPAIHVGLEGERRTDCRLPQGPGDLPGCDRHHPPSCRLSGGIHLPLAGGGGDRLFRSLGDNKMLGVLGNQRNLEAAELVL